MPKATSSTRPKLTNDVHKTWKELCEFSELRLEAFGTRKNQLACEAKGEHANYSDPRYFHNSNRQVGIFLEKVVSSEIKKIPDWLRKAKESLAVVCDVTVDDYKPEIGDRIYSPGYLAEAIDAVEHCIKKYHQQESL